MTVAKAAQPHRVPYDNQERALKVAPFILAAAVALTGCASTPVVQSPAELRSTHGFVVATLPSTDTGDTLTLRAVDTGTTYTLQNKGDFGPHAVGLWVPQGRYEIDGYAQDDKASPDTHITVRASRLTDLGMLARFDIGGYASVQVPVSHPEARLAEQAARSALLPHLSAPETIEWRPTTRLPARKPPADYGNMGLVVALMVEYQRSVNEPPVNVRMKEATTNQALYDIALATLPPRTDKVASDGNGNLYYGASLGQLRARRADGRWDHIDTGTAQWITAVGTDDQRILAGTYRGAVRVSDDRGKTWRHLAQLPSSEPVIGIDRVGSRWLVATAVSTYRIPAMVYITTGVKVYAASAPDLVDLKLIRDVPLSNGYVGSADAFPHVQTYQNFYYVSAGSDILRLDVPTMQWTPLKSLNDAEHFNVSAKTGMITSTTIKGAFSKLSTSSDNGATWQKRDTPGYPIYDVLYDTPELGFATRYDLGAFSNGLQFVTYDAKADRWTKAYDAPAGCMMILRDATRRQRFCVTTGGSILDYAGGQWKVEFGVN